MLTTLAVSNYRSLRELVLPLGRLTVVTGANGVGKSSLYRCLKLLGDTAHGGLVGSLAREGGLPSTLWAGPETISRSMRRGDAPIEGTVRKAPVRLRLGFNSDDFGYAIELGLPPPSANAFPRDPEIKREVVWAGPSLRRSNLLVDRTRNLLLCADEEGRWGQFTQNMPMFESMLTRMADPSRAPEILLLRDRIRDWRFYDHLRTDPNAPARRPAIGTWTPALSHDGSDLAAALQTLQMCDHERTFDAIIDDAFPGCSVGVFGEDALLSVAMRQPGLLRPLHAAELSEGTLRYLMLATALSSPFPPELMVLNEPEASLHTDLLPALARLIAQASERCQLWVVTHSDALAHALVEAGATHHVLEKDTGETVLQGQDLLNRPEWTWPKRGS